VAIADFKNAGYNDLAIGPDGVIHAVWQDQQPGANRWQLFYSASHDGVCWSTPLELSGAEGRVSLVRIAIDGGGRVYALWKAKSTGASLGPELNVSSTLSSDNGSLRYRVLERGRWSPVIPVGRENNVFGWFPTADPQGYVHLVGSENSDPQRQSAMVWNNWANTIWKARLDGPAFAREVVVNEPGIGFYALHGYVNGQGQVHFAGLGNGRLLHWNGSQLSVLLEGVPGNDMKDAPRLLRDARGEGHLIVYDRNSKSVVDWPTAAGSPARAIYAAANNGSSRIEDFQAWQGKDGQMLVTVEVKGAAGAATDLYVVRDEGSGWSTPINVTGNAARGGAVGYMNVNGSTINQVSEWSAAYAAAAVNPAGGIDLLVTNSRSSVHTNIQVTAIGRSGFAGGWSYPQVYFTRLGSAGIRPTHATPPVPTTLAGDQPSTGEAATPGTSTPAYTPPADPTPAAGGGLPMGRYTCSYVSPYAGEIPTAKTVTIFEGGRYQSFDGGSGTYDFNQGARSVHWRSGPFAGNGVVAEFFRRDDGKPALKIAPAGGSNEPSQTNYCVLLSG
jgi:hypothetical protein